MTKFKTSWHQSQSAGFLNPGTPRKAGGPLDVFALAKIMLYKCYWCRVHFMHSMSKVPCSILRAQQTNMSFKNRKSDIGGRNGVPRRRALSLWLFCFQYFFLWNHSNQYWPSFFHIFPPKDSRLVVGDVFLGYPPQFVKISTQHHRLIGMGWEGGWVSRYAAEAIIRSRRVRRRGNSREELSLRTWREQSEMKHLG